MPENHVKVFKKGEIISAEGTYEQWMYEIVSGSIGIYKNYGKEDENLLAVVNDGYLGEMGLIDALPRSATTVALEDTELFIVDEETFVSFFRQHPEKITKLLMCLAARMDNIDESYMSACTTIRDILVAEGAHVEKDNVVVKAMKKFSAFFKSVNR